MMVFYHQRFEKQLARLLPKQRNQVEERLALFGDDPFNQMLNNHQLHGRYSGYRSINISGDFRALFKMIDNGDCIFVKIGTHHQLYSS